MLYIKISGPQVSRDSDLVSVHATSPLREWRLSEGASEAGGYIQRSELREEPRNVIHR